MNLTKRYFKLRDDIVQAINDSALPPLAAEQCLRELRAELLTVVERELREDANVVTTRSGDSSDPFRHGSAVPPPLGHQEEASEGRHQGEARGAEGEPSQSPTATALPKGEPSAETRKGG